MKKDVIYRCIGNDFNKGILACGYMPKKGKDYSQIDFTIEYYSCFFIISGSGDYITPDGQILQMQTGDFVQRLPNRRHSTFIHESTEDEWLEFFISFGKSTYDYLVSLNLLPISSPIIPLGMNDQLLEGFSKILHDMKTASELDLPLINLKLQKTLLLALQTSDLHPINTTMEKAAYLLTNKVNEEIALQDVAASINMSYESFRKHFKSYSGLSPERFRINEKIKQAKLMLLSGLSIKETAHFTGYSDTYSFTKQFTKSVGMPPGRYQKLNIS